MLAFSRVDWDLDCVTEGRAVGTSSEDTYAPAYSWQLGYRQFWGLSKVHMCMMQHMDQRRQWLLKCLLPLHVR